MTSPTTSAQSTSSPQATDHEQRGNPTAAPQRSGSTRAGADASARRSGWRESLSAFLQPTVLRMLFLGFSAGLPILLIFSSLSLWLREAGVSRSAVTMFSWAALGYSFKFVWAPLVDKLPLPLLTTWLGRRRSWLLLAQVAIILAICWMAISDPANGQGALTALAGAAVLLGFSSATQDIVIDAYRIESAPANLQALLSSTYIAGYRIGMLVAGAGALYLAAAFGSTAEIYDYAAWRNTYFIMAAMMLIGIATTLRIPEPRMAAELQTATTLDTREIMRILFLFAVCVALFIATFIVSADWVAIARKSLTAYLGNKALASFITETIRLGIALLAALSGAKLLTMTGGVDKDTVNSTYIDPVRDFFRRYKIQLAALLLLLIGVYRISDIVLGVISNVFYQDLGFTKPEIAGVVKTYGLFMTLIGGFAGGLLAVRWGVLRILMLGAILSAATNLLFMWLAGVGHSIPALIVVISADNLSAGIASSAFVAFLSALTHIRFTAVQYAIFSSLMTLIPKVLGGYSGAMVDQLGYPPFFLLTAALGVPVIVLIWMARKRLDLKTP